MMAGHEGYHCGPLTLLVKQTRQRASFLLQTAVLQQYDRNTHSQNALQPVAAQSGLQKPVLRNYRLHRCRCL